VGGCLSAIFYTRNPIPEEFLLLVNGVFQKFLGSWMQCLRFAHCPGDNKRTTKSRKIAKQKYTWRYEEGSSGKGRLPGSCQDLGLYYLIDLMTAQGLPRCGKS
jgi:hypothetical protein